MSVPFPEQREQIRQIAALVVHRDPSDWPEGWDILIDHARRTAWQNLLSCLTARGYSPHQIACWDGCAEYLRDLTLYWVLTMAAAFTAVPETVLRRLDRRSELHTVQITIQGQPCCPREQVIRFGS
ncbi:MAG: hypothetical protein RMJ19_02020 [Gemmatales bacterium]|nr:hypothetical protein [Gemmatales bacterium]MCS7159223.1 hypothetical protein [Gemmatales bacterium]MDW8174423.1 hypothetical protein [Gemmatales bacterium]MDW8222270.1 hypothetical protein [Gemmatales bacterium]